MAQRQLFQSFAVGNVVRFMKLQVGSKRGRVSQQHAAFDAAFVGFHGTDHQPRPVSAPLIQRRRRAAKLRLDAAQPLQRPPRYVQTQEPFHESSICPKVHIMPICLSRRL